MDERAINGAAIEAIHDLELDCEIKDVCRRSGGEEWCIQFSGKYGQFCDKFKNQFDEESSPQVMREKIKSYLIKQVSKIRSSTGRKRKPAVKDNSESRSSEGGILSAPLKMIGEVFDRVTGIAGGVMEQAATVAGTARDAVADVAADVAANIPPVTIEVKSVTRASKKRASPSTAKKKTAKQARPKAAKAKKATKRVVGSASKQAKKSAKKIVKKTAKKSAGKTSRRAR
ncbi:MAG TPA: hypothetical protein VM095_10150 [Pyrinomonadaceae bacterium]|nr:hypothetical protein [Pyrinomonadaceae bacterium]